MDSATTQNRLCNEALAAERAGRADDASDLFKKAISCDPSNPVPYLFLGHALHLAGHRTAAVQAWSLGTDLDPRVINAWRVAGSPTEVAERSELANQHLRKHFTSLHAVTMEEYQRNHPDCDIDRIADAIWCQTHSEEFEYRDPHQQPHLFFVPELTPIAVYSEEQMPWTSQLEDACDDILAEFLAACEVAADEQRPYLEPSAKALGTDWNPIANTLNWGSFHLYKKGQPNQRLLELFPKTLDVLRELPLIEASHGPSEVLFSVLKGGQRIPPHFGVSNTDMTVHLPIVTTERSAIRVVDTVYEWQQGKVFSFDDAYEHESWNDSAEARTNLLFEAWHPELTMDERGAIRAAFAARETWSRSRRL